MGAAIPILISKGFMSEIRGCEIMTLGQREEQFLRMIGIAKEISVYEIYSALNEGETDKGKARKLPDLRSPHDDSMSYKNVHKRVKRLYQMNLIEEVKEKRRYRRKIKYKLTSHGFLQFFTSTVSHPVFSLSELLGNYKDNLILDTILFQYFRMETVQELITIFDQWIFHGYLRECCENIFAVSWGTGMLTDKEFQGALKMKTEATEYFLKSELRNLINEIIIRSVEPMHKDYFPNKVLVEDDKFIHLVENLRDDFHNGCKKVLYAH